MNEKTQKICYIIGAGPWEKPDSRYFAPKDGDCVIAADGGLRYLNEVGVSPDLIVGDFDTLGYVPAGENVVRLNVMKDWTDTFVAMEKGIDLGFEVFLFFGCLGGKLEHTMANLQHLVWLAERGLEGWMFDGRVWVTAVCGAKSVLLPARDSGMVSVFSMSQKAEGVTIQGLKYALQDGELTNAFPLGVSNEFVGERAEIGVKKGTLLVMIEAEGR